jgi:hypothetical protein
VGQQEIFSQDPWEREMSRGLVLDQEQLGEGVISGRSVCQVFTPAMSRLERLDIITKNRTDVMPGRLRLWAWEASYEQSTTGQPLWEEGLEFGGPDAPYLRHYFPRVALEPGKQYMLECSRPSEAFYMAGVTHDAYAGGFAITDGRERPDWDLWFRTFGPALEGAPTGLSPRPLPPVPDTTARPPRQPAPVSREIYLQMVRDYVGQEWEGWARQGGRRVSDLLFYTGFLFRHAGETQWAQHVAQWLRDGDAYLREHEEYGGGPWTVEQVGWGIRWYRGNELWTGEDEQTARQLMLTATRRLWQTPERGAMNRAMWDVHCTRLAADLYPDAPEADDWRKFSDDVWHDWADYDDTNEDSSHYNAVFLHFMVGYAYLAGQLDLFRRPGMRQFMDRYRDVITPTGMMVGWGDSPGFGADWGGWIAAFEAAASATGDGTYKWAAHALLEGHRRNILEDDPLQHGYEDMRSMPLAYLVGDDSIRAVSPAPRSAVFTTAYPRYNGPRLRREQDMPAYSLQEREVPWKMVMGDSGGWDAYYALFGLLPMGGHGHVDAPALLALFANGTMLLHDTAYFHKQWCDHNLLYGVRVSGGTLGEAPAETQVKAFTETGVLCYADIAWQDHAGWGLDLRRELLFAKGLGWWVRDRTDAREPCEWLLGPLWHVDRILGRGESWFDVDYPEPMSFAWPSANGTDHLLICFTPKPRASVDYADMTHRVLAGKPWYSSAPWAVYQCEGPIALGQNARAHYNSLLVPLRPGEEAARLADDIEVLLDDAGATLVQLRRGDTLWTLALNNDGRRLTIGPTTTDARAVVVRTPRDGQPVIGLVER